ncbi:fucolectin-5-like [Patiria miniata]|uniref:Fucolectin tachylectin-4 pentraxin-1 domain-containing protein n=1 Tax=Patiria miniata TaxID=46514 RepID=A0A914BD82_PATMI|nr:fucolectin-5-like [Patiria miniata]
MGNSFFSISEILLCCIQYAYCDLTALPLVNKQAWQSTSGGPAGRAINNSYQTFQYTDTGDPHPWWIVDLDGEHCLGRVTVTLRTGCCGQHRFTGALVRAGLNMNVTNDPSPPCGSPAFRNQSSDGATNKFLCDPPRMARYVSLDINISRPGVTASNAYLQLAEVNLEEYTSGECDAPKIGKS